MSARNPRRYRWVPLPMAEPLDVESLKHRLSKLPMHEELTLRMLLHRLMEGGENPGPVLLAGGGELPEGYWVARGKIRRYFWVDLGAYRARVYRNI